MTHHTPKHKLTAAAAPGAAADQGSGRALEPLHSLVRHWKLAIALALGIIAVGVPFAWKKGASKYRAEGVLYISPHFIRNLDADQEHDMPSNSQYREFVQQQVRTINRFDILDAAVAPGTKAGQYWRNSNETQRRAVDRLRAQLDIKSVPDTYQVTIGLEGAKAEGLAEVVNAAMDSYVRTAHKEILYDSDGRLKALDQEKQDLEATAAKITEERTAISSRLGTTVFSGALVNSFDRELGSSSEALMDARRQRIVAEAAVGDKEAIAGTNASALMNALNDASLNGFKSSLNQRKAELMVQMTGLSAQHPNRIAAEKEIRAIDREIEAVTIALRDRLAGNLETINRAKLQQSATVEQRLTKETQQIRAKIDDYSRGYQRSLELGEELDRTRKRIHAVEDRISFLSLETRAPGFVRIFSPALTPDLPFEGGRKKLFLIVLLAALALGVALPVGLDFMDPRIKAPHELEIHVGLPVTGWLPDSAQTDATAMLRTAVSIRRHLTELPHRVVVITGLGHGGGSSTVTLGLGNALNRLGTRTLVVEANPLTRDPRYLAAPGQTTGLTTWLNEINDVDNFPVTPASGNLPDRVPTGPGSMEDLLPVERFHTLFDEQANAWDLILIDAAPLETSLATEELIRVFGAALLVIDSQTDRKQTVTRVLSKIDHLAPDAFGAVLNKVSGKPTLAGSRKKQNDNPAVLAA